MHLQIYKIIEKSCEMRKIFYKLRLDNKEKDQVSYIKSHTNVNIAHYLRLCIKRLYEEVKRKNGEHVNELE